MAYVKSNFNYREYVNQLVEENGVEVRKVNLIGMKKDLQNNRVNVDFVELTPKRKEKMSGYNLVQCSIDIDTAPTIVIPAFAEVDVEFAKTMIGSDKVYINRFLGLEKFIEKEE